MKVYVTFKEKHLHKINGVTYDKNCVAGFHAKSIQDGERVAKELFGKEYEFVNPADWFEWEINPVAFPDGVKMVKWDRLD